MKVGPVVDMHAHLAVVETDRLVAGIPGAVAEFERERQAHSAHSLEINAAQLGRVVPLMADLDQRLADMDGMGVDAQVVGPMPMHHYWADEQLAVRIARTTNEGVADHCSRAPGRLLGLGTAPLQHPQRAVQELTHAVEELGLAGISVSTNVAGRELADPSLESFWEAAEALEVVIFIHPWGCSLGSRLAAHYLGNIVGQPVETAVALAHLIFSGLLDRRPGLRLLAAHGGGYLPTYMGRCDHAWQVRVDARGCLEPPSSYLRRLWFDALVFSSAGLGHLVDGVGPGRVVLGSDYPFDMGVHDPVERVEKAQSVPSGERVAILGRNALELIGGPAQRLVAHHGAVAR